jgi:hypothetical protein
MTNTNDNTPAQSRIYVRKNHVLPQEVADQFAKWTTHAPQRNGYIKALREMGWTLEAIAEAVGGKSRERVRQICAETPVSDAFAAVAAGYPVPEPPYFYTKPARQFVEPSPEILARLLELQPYAQSVRSNSPAFRAEAEEYTALLNQAHAVDGVTLYRLAKRLGVTHGALRFRLVRYGYKEPVTGSSKVYNKIHDENRVNTTRNYVQ